MAIIDTNLIGVILKLSIHLTLCGDFGMLAMMIMNQADCLTFLSQFKHLKTSEFD